MNDSAPPPGFLPVLRKRRDSAWNDIDSERVLQVLVNLHPEPPPFFSRFERLADVVGRDPALAEAGRRR